MVVTECNDPKHEHLHRWVDAWETFAEDVLPTVVEGVRAGDADAKQLLSIVFMSGTIAGLGVLNNTGHLSPEGAYVLHALHHKLDVGATT